MARKRMVTRTILTTKVNVLCMDTDSCEACNRDIILPCTYKDEEKLLKAVQKVVDTDDFKAVKITDYDTVETLYGMDEQKFIDNSVVLDPETRKLLESEADEDETDEDDTEETEN